MQRRDILRQGAALATTALAATPFFAPFAQSAAPHWTLAVTGAPGTLPRGADGQNHVAGGLLTP